MGLHEKQFSHWAAKVLALGFTVARIEEVRNAAGAVSSRRTARVYTPATATDLLQVLPCASRGLTPEYNDL